MTNPSPVVARHSGQIILALGVLIFGAALAYATTLLPEATGYAKVGPRLMPTLVSIGIILLGLLLIKEALTGGFRDIDETVHAAKEMGTPTDWRAFGWISAGLILDGLLIVTAGFVIAGTLLFVLAARGFGGTGGRRYLKNGVIGLIISASTYAFFTYGLGLALPRGVLPF